MAKKKSNSEIDVDDLKQNIMDVLTQIKDFRKQRGWTIAELSQKAGVSVGIISELENKNNKDSKDKKVPSLVNFIAISRSLRLPKEFVLDLILNYKENYEPKNRREKLISSLKDYGILDKESIDLIMRTVDFSRNRGKKKTLFND